MVKKLDKNNLLPTLNKNTHNLKIMKLKILKIQSMFQNLKISRVFYHM